MKRIIVGECVLQNIFNQLDPDVPLEAEFEATVVRALTCLYKNYMCFRFTGGFQYDENTYQPDLALVAKDLSHWFVIEVELSTHSFDQHVLRQVKAFQYGTPRPECSRILARELEIDPQHAENFVAYVPRSVAVIANKYIDTWELKLQAHTIPLLTVSLPHVRRFRSRRIEWQFGCSEREHRVCEVLDDRPIPTLPKRRTVAGRANPDD